MIRIKLIEEAGGTVLIDVPHIESIELGDRCTIIRMHTGNYYKTEDNVEEVLKKSGWLAEPLKG